MRCDLLTSHEPTRWLNSCPISLPTVYPSRYGKPLKLLNQPLTPQRKLSTPPILHRIIEATPPKPTHIMQPPRNLLLRPRDLHLAWNTAIGAGRVQRVITPLIVEDKEFPTAGVFIVWPSCVPFAVWLLCSFQDCLLAARVAVRGSPGCRCEVVVGSWSDKRNGCHVDCGLWICLKLVSACC